MACLAVCAGTALASRPAHPGEKRAIARAAKRSPDTQGVRGKFDVVHVRISAVDRQWARASLRPKRRFGDQFDTATAALHLAHGHWRLRSLGTADVGCVIPRAAVRRDSACSAAARAERRRNRTYPPAGCAG